MWWNFPCPPYVGDGLIKIPLEFLGSHCNRCRDILSGPGVSFLGCLMTSQHCLHVGLSSLNPSCGRSMSFIIDMALSWSHGESPEKWGTCRRADPSVGCGLEVQKGVRSHIHSDWKKIFPWWCAFRRNCRNALWAPLISLSPMYAAQSCSVYGERRLEMTALRSACSRGLMSGSFLGCCMTNCVISLSIMSALATGAQSV